jgi:DNA-binding HxlR family transcriptional regulator
MSHTFHIPVLGLGYSIDTPLKVARYGISSVVSIVDDQLIERMREYHQADKNSFVPINIKEPDFRSRRITAYLNLLDELVEQQHQELKRQGFTPKSDITRYFELMPDHSDEAITYRQMLSEANPYKKSFLQNRLRAMIKKGAIDVNIMSKVDKINHAKSGTPDGEQLSDALAALKGFAESNLTSSLILSAGMNPRLYSYIEEFRDFFPLGGQPSRKKIILKVSDYRSAFIQAKFLAKKGVWVHEFRIESGLNCGGHAFATEGYLLGPILEEFKQKRTEMIDELFKGYRSALTDKGFENIGVPLTRITVQGGIGTAEENEFLRQHYQLDGTGWGSPFLLVPEATNVDENTLQQLAVAGEEDFYISGASPLGIPFNNFRHSSAEAQRLRRIEEGRPGSPCTKKYLVSNTEFTKEAICTASRKYQTLKIKELKKRELSKEEYQERFNDITEKVCLCEGLCSSAYLKNDIAKPKENRAVTICPGPNTAYFSSVYSLDEMVRHIYGKLNLLEGVNRPSMFVNELKLYVNYLKKDIESSLRDMSDKKANQINKFKEQLLNGIGYYEALIPELIRYQKNVKASFENDLKHLRQMTELAWTPVFSAD